MPGRSWAILVVTAIFIGTLAQPSDGFLLLGALSRISSSRSSVSRSCTSAAGGLFFACGRQYRYLYRVFGYPLFFPNISPELQTPEVLAGMPDVSGACCRASFEFQSNLCACDPDTIEYFRSTSLFDPEMTEPSARYIYGTLCGGPVTVGDDCPDGNPFDIIRARGKK